MVERLKDLREPAAFVLLAVLIVRLLMGLVSVFMLASSDRLDSFAAAAHSVTPWVIDPLALVVLTGVLVACTLVDATPRARPLTVAGLVLAIASIAVTLVLGLIGVIGLGSGADETPSFVLFLADLAVPVLATLVLARMLPRHPAPARPPALALDHPQPAVDHPAAAQPGDSQPDSSEPTWQPDQAAGAAWTTASDAASGAGASGWGTPGESGGWDPTETVPESLPGTEETQPPNGTPNDGDHTGR